MVSESAMRAILEFSCTSIITVLPKPCFLYLSDGISDKRSRLGPLLQWLPERALPREVRVRTNVPGKTALRCCRNSAVRIRVRFWNLREMIQVLTFLFPERALCV